MNKEKENKIRKKAEYIESLLLNEDEWDVELFGNELQSEVWSLIKLIKGENIGDYIDDNRSCRYRDKHGYRENLGFDKQPNMESYISKLELTYQEECKLNDYFYMRMESI